MLAFLKYDGNLRQRELLREVVLSERRMESSSPIGCGVVNLLSRRPLSSPVLEVLRTPPYLKSGHYPSLKSHKYWYIDPPLLCSMRLYFAST